MTESVGIDYVIGSEGYFLEYACSKFLLKQDTVQLPFKPTDVFAISNRQFHSDHWTTKNIVCPYNKIIKITFTEEDILHILSNAVHQANNFNADVRWIDTLTYIKFNNDFCRNWIDDINETFKNRYNYALLSKTNVHCKRSILRLYFQKYFKDLKNNFLIKQMDDIKNNNSSKDCFTFEFQNFWHTNKFAVKFKQLAEWYGITDYDESKLRRDLRYFKASNFYKDNKLQSDLIISQALQKKEFEIPALTIFQESYITAKFEEHYGIVIHELGEKYFGTSSDLMFHIENEKFINNAT